MMQETQAISPTESAGDVIQRVLLCIIGSNELDELLQGHELVQKQHVTVVSMGHQHSHVIKCHESHKLVKVECLQNILDFNLREISDFKHLMDAFLLSSLGSHGCYQCPIVQWLMEST